MRCRVPAVARIRRLQRLSDDDARGRNAVRHDLSDGCTREVRAVGCGVHEQTLLRGVARRTLVVELDEEGVDDVGTCGCPDGAVTAGLQRPHAEGSARADDAEIRRLRCVRDEALGAERLTCRYAGVDNPLNGLRGRQRCVRETLAHVLQVEVDTVEVVSDRPRRGLLPESCAGHCRKRYVRRAPHGHHDDGALRVRVRDGGGLIRLTDGRPRLRHIDRAQSGHIECEDDDGDATIHHGSDRLVRSGPVHVTSVDVHNLHRRRRRDAQSLTARV